MSSISFSHTKSLLNQTAILNPIQSKNLAEVLDKCSLAVKNAYELNKKNTIPQKKIDREVILNAANAFPFDDHDALIKLREFESFVASEETYNAALKEINMAIKNLAIELFAVVNQSYLSWVYQMTKTTAQSVAKIGYDLYKTLVSSPVVSTATPSENSSVGGFMFKSTYFTSSSRDSNILYLWIPSSSLLISDNYKLNKYPFPITACHIANKSNNLFEISEKQISAQLIVNDIIAMTDRKTWHEVTVPSEMAQSFIKLKNDRDALEEALHKLDFIRQKRNWNILAPNKNSCLNSKE